MEGLGDPRFWLDLVQWATTLAIGGYVWATGRQRATKQSIADARTHADEIREEAGQRLDRHAERLIKLEARLEHVPSNEAIESLNARLAELHGDFKQMTGWLEGVKGLLGTMQNSVQQLVENELRGRKP